jgi:O-acetyl-ADP-ribose deacetylase (regulator of RNase III)
LGARVIGRTTVAVYRVEDGDLLQLSVEVIVNPWNRNLVPWWLLIPQGVSGAIKRRAGIEPFKHLARKGVLPLGGAVSTPAGRLQCRAIIHVAAINLLWKASERSIRMSVTNAMRIVNQEGYASIGFPILGSGSGGFPKQRALDVMLEELCGIDSPAVVIVVRFGMN